MGIVVVTSGTGDDDAGDVGSGGGGDDGDGGISSS